jgi:hypothetical protein
LSAPGDNLPTAAKVLADFIMLVVITFALGTAFGVMLDRVFR